MEVRRGKQTVSVGVAGQKCGFIKRIKALILSCSRSFSPNQVTGRAKWSRDKDARMGEGANHSLVCCIHTHARAQAAATRRRHLDLKPVDFSRSTDRLTGKTATAIIKKRRE